jgi:hypothetical protein
MNASERYEELRESAHIKGHRRNPNVDGAPQELCLSEQTLPRNPVGPFVPDEGAFETFVDGSGI